VNREELRRISDFAASKGVGVKVYLADDGEIHAWPSADIEPNHIHLVNVEEF
jgi:hypothetical protein